MPRLEVYPSEQPYAPVLRISRLIEESDRAALVAWALANRDQYVNGIDLTVPGLRVTKRVTTRLNPNVHYPPVAFAVRDKIAAYLKLDLPISDGGHGNDGMLSVITYPGCGTYRHIDPKVRGEDRHTLRLNVLAQAPEAGGALFVGQQQIPFEQGDVIGVLVTEQFHHVELVQGACPRILFLFGYLATSRQWRAVVDSLA